MKKNILKLAIGTFVVGGLVTAVIVDARTASPAAASSLDALSKATTLELPAVAARLVTQAAPAQRVATASEVLTAVNALSRPGVMPYVVSSICAAAPEVAPDVAADAVILQPDLALGSVKAAIAAAPEQSEAVVRAVCSKQPDSFVQVASVAATEAPTRSKEIVNGVATALPQLQPFIAKASTDGISAQNVSQVLQQVNSMAVTANRDTYIATQTKTVEATLLANASQSGASTAVDPAQLRTLNNTVKADIAKAVNEVVPASATRAAAPKITTPVTPVSGTPGTVSYSDTAATGPGYSRNYSAP